MATTAVARSRKLNIMSPLRIPPIRGKIILENMMIFRCSTPGSGRKSLLDFESKSQVFDTTSEEDFSELSQYFYLIFSSRSASDPNLLFSEEFRTLEFQHHPVNRIPNRQDRKSCSLVDQIPWLLVQLKPLHFPQNISRKIRKSI